MGDANSLNYSDLTEKDVDEVVAFMAKHFYPREPISTGLHMTYEDNKEWIHGSVRDWVKNGVSVVAREPDTKAVAGTIIATILTRDQSNTYEQALTSPKTKESERRGRLFGCTLATAQATAVPSQRLLYRLGYESLYTLDYATFEIAGDRVFDMDKMLGTPSAKVMARLIDESVDK
ncbi:uncharacterized protein [Procambarus clarkii]|uniref:uncharacterized protein isoform X3 n=1 Tax=Procambarus clarkii TaxID=6728 RepID=UPI0037446720